VNTRHLENGLLIKEEDKYYITSLEKTRLTGQQWLKVARGHWAVENNGHWTLDAVFREDEKPWFPSSPRGTVVMMVLRRIAYSMLAIFRGVTMRSEENRRMPWKRLMTWVLDTLIASTQEHLAGLRRRLESETSSAFS
jgi:hypothetical protein